MKSDRPHCKLIAWQKSMDLYVAIFKLTQSLPKEELFGLSSQMRRSALSVPSNIAEGAAKDSQKDFSRFLNTAQGSLSELETQLDAGQRVGYFSDELTSPIFELTHEISALVAGLKQRRNTKS